MGDDDDDNKFKVCIKCNRDTQWKRKIALSDLWYSPDDIYLMLQFLHDETFNKNNLEFNKKIKKMTKKNKYLEFKKKIEKMMKKKKNKKKTTKENIIDIKPYDSDYYKSQHICFQTQREELLADYPNIDYHDHHIHKLMAITVHAVFLESDFVGYDQISGNQINHKFHQLPFSSTVSFCYTLSDILKKNESKLPQTVELDFESFEQCLSVSVKSKQEEGSIVFQLFFYNHKLESILRFPLSVQHRDGFEQFWTSVRDELAFPLKVKLREEAGFSSLPCLIELHPDLKMKILEFLPGNDVGRLGCTCKEFRILCDDKKENDFWQTKMPCCTCDVRPRHDKTFINWKEVFEDYYIHIVSTPKYFEGLYKKEKRKENINAAKRARPNFYFYKNYPKNTPLLTLYKEMMSKQI
ncbi:hypothetical protein F8388_020777 [Cannabis sativa]|nr:hypothetical protein F8388_020777 [Cannabis sativa]KAF4396088.1 hypothetical protein G4B88_020725 [Cannabis sativa]